jgi:hypothetical protein
VQKPFQVEHLSQGLLAALGPPQPG